MCGVYIVVVLMKKLYAYNLLSDPKPSTHVTGRFKGSLLASLEPYFRTNWINTVELSCAVM